MKLQVLHICFCKVLLALARFDGVTPTSAEGLGSARSVKHKRQRKSTEFKLIRSEMPSQSSLVQEAASTEASTELIDSVSGSSNGTVTSSRAVPSYACCMRQVLKYEAVDVMQGNHTPVITRASIEFMCKRSKCNANNGWTAVEGTFCSSGYTKGIEAGIVDGIEDRENTAWGLTKTSSCDAAAVATTDNNGDDEADGMDEDPNAAPMASCCMLATNKPDVFTKVRFECKSRPCWGRRRDNSRGNWLYAHGQYCSEAWRLAGDAGLISQTELHQRTFCEGFDGTPDVRVKLPKWIQGR